MIMKYKIIANDSVFFVVGELVGVQQSDDKTLTITFIDETMNFVEVIERDVEKFSLNVIN